MAKGSKEVMVYRQIKSKELPNYTKALYGMIKPLMGEGYGFEGKATPVRARIKMYKDGKIVGCILKEYDSPDELMFCLFDDSTEDVREYFEQEGLELRDKPIRVNGEDCMTFSLKNSDFEYSNQDYFLEDYYDKEFNFLPRINNFNILVYPDESTPLVAMNTSLLNESERKEFNESFPAEEFKKSVKYYFFQDLE